MMIRKITNVLILSLLSALFACQQKNAEIDLTGEFPVKLSMAGDFTVNPQSKSEQSDAQEAPLWENPENYSIQVLRNLSDNWEPYAGFSKFAELPENKMLRFQYGEYQFKCWWGKNNIAAFDSPFYYGETRVKVEEEAINAEGYIPVVMEPSLANTKLKIIFTREFQHVFNQYVYIAVQIYTAESAGKPLVYKMDETRDAYVRSAPIHMKLSLQKFDGTRYSYGLCTMEDVKPKDFFTVTLNADADPSTAAFNVTIKEETNRVEINESIPLSAIVKEEPKIKLSFVSPFETVCELQENQNPKLIAVNTDAGLKSLTLEHNVEELTAAGVASGASLLDASVVSLLKNQGIDLNAEVENTSSTVIFTELLNRIRLKGADSRSLDFKVAAEDLAGKTVSQEFSFTIQKAEFTQPVIYPGDIWTKEVVLRPLRAENLKKGNAEKFVKEAKYAYSKDNGSTWVPFEFTGETYTVSGIAPGGVCKIKYAFSDQAESIKEVTLYPTTPITNGGFEDYASSRLSNSISKGYIYNYSFDGWGNTNNVTLSPNKKQQYNNWCSAESIAGGTSGRGVLVQTIAWGTNTAVEGNGYVIDKVTGGAMFLGAMNGQTPQQGAGFNSRPTGLKYKYKFTGNKDGGKNDRPYRVQVKVEHRDASGNTYVLGEGIFDSTEKVDAWKERTVNIVYNNDYIQFAPTHLCVLFLATHDSSLGLYTDQSITLDKSDVSKYKGSIGVQWDPMDWYLDWKYIGNRLWLDEVALVYEK